MPNRAPAFGTLSRRTDGVDDAVIINGMRIINRNNIPNAKRYFLKNVRSWRR